MSHFRDFKWQDTGILHNTIVFALIIENPIRFGKAQFAFFRLSHIPHPQSLIQCVTRGPGNAAGCARAPGNAAGGASRFSAASVSNPSATPAPKRRPLFSRGSMPIYPAFRSSFLASSADCGSPAGASRRMTKAASCTAAFLFMMRSGEKQACRTVCFSPATRAGANRKKPV